MTQVNGEYSHNLNSSLFLDHLLTYPVVKDGVTTFQNNQLGQKSIQLGDTAYRRLSQTVIPYLAKPYQYVSPYVERADQLGEQTLSKVDERFPVIKKPTDELYTDAKNLVLLPYHRGMQGKEHVLGVYNAECKKFEGENLIVYSKALVGTVFTIGGQTLDWVGGFLGSKKEDVKDVASEKANH